MAQMEFGGLAEQYLPGRPLHVSELSQPDNLAQVADLLAQFHSLSPSVTIASNRSTTVLQLVDGSK